MAKLNLSTLPKLRPSAYTDYADYIEDCLYEQYLQQFYEENPF